MKSIRAVVFGSVVLATLVAVLSCASWTREGLDATALPPEVRVDYALFAQRCSKCHSLARPLTSGIDEDAYWIDYVARMRRQPASGISEEDTVGILRFLHYFSMEEKRKSGRLPPLAVGPATAPIPAAPSPPAPAVSPSPANSPPPAALPSAAPAAPPTSGAKL
jgi:hypothetical protein